MSRVIFGGKLLGETKSLSFDFTSQLAAGETISSATVTAAVYSGSDPTPSGLLYASPAISGAVVSQKVWAGVLGVTYCLLCSATTSTEQVLQLLGYLVVTPNQI